MTGNKLFDNTQKAFVLKTDAALERAYALFRMISSESLVKIGTNLTKMALNMHLPVEGLIRATVFDHFCGYIYHTFRFFMGASVQGWQADRSEGEDARTDEKIGNMMHVI